MYYPGISYIRLKISRKEEEVGSLLHPHGTRVKSFRITERLQHRLPGRPSCLPGFHFFPTPSTQRERQTFFFFLFFFLLFSIFSSFLFSRSSYYQVRLWFSSLQWQLTHLPVSQIITSSKRNWESKYTHTFFLFTSQLRPGDSDVET